MRNVVIRTDLGAYRAVVKTKVETGVPGMKSAFKSATEAEREKRLELWKRAIERGDAEVLAQAIVEQREIPEALRAAWGLSSRTNPTGQNELVDELKREQLAIVDASGALTPTARALDDAEGLSLG
jgi:predicted short-subunit dehydrogenase-like oxidoreductase (DUF2520 family)